MFSFILSYRYLFLPTFRKRKKEYLDIPDIISPELSDFENIEIAYHDNQIYQQELNQYYEQLHDLQDYIAKWCHEVKIPLSATLLMNEKIEEDTLKLEMKEQLERINQYLNPVLVSCKVQSQIYDIQIKKTSLKECIQTSIKNQRFFLIKKQFEIKLDIHQETVYSDPTWLVYIFDQIMANAIKYATINPYLHIWSVHNKETLSLYIEDHSEGILEKDIRRIFEKGYAGSNHHNGQYKSTGMGLYMVKTMIDKLGHSIFVESEFGKYTRFRIEFKDHRDYFNL